MAQNWNKVDVYAFVNDLVDQTMNGNASIKATDTSSFVEVGELLKSVGYEKTLDAISQVFAKDIFSIRKYKGKLDIIQRDEREWGAIVRKLTPLYKPLEQSTDNNTDIATPLSDGQSVDQYKINKPKVIETVFVGTKVIQKSLTNFTKSQLNVAFSSEANFVAFLGMVQQAFENQLEKDFETMRRACVMNYIGALYECGLYVDLAYEFNKTYNTAYTRDQLLTTYFENFVKFANAKITKDSNMFTEYTSVYHQNITGYDPIPRHTPKEKQRLIMYEPYMIDARFNVLSTIFNPDKLSIGEYEKVNFWQDIKRGPEVNVQASYLGANGEKTTASAAVKFDYVLGILYDVDAMGWTNIFESIDTSPFNAAGRYYCQYYHGQSCPFIDLTENGRLYIIGAGGVNPNEQANNSVVTDGETKTTTKKK
jgi:hypothetical protein